MEPQIGQTYELEHPWGPSRVTHTVRNWIHIEPADDRDTFDDPRQWGRAVLSKSAARNLGIPGAGGKWVRIALLNGVATAWSPVGDLLGRDLKLGSDLKSPKLERRKRVPTRIKRKFWRNRQAKAVAA